MTVSSKPARSVALVSLALSVIFFGVAFFVGRWSGFFVIVEIGWLILAAMLIWFVLCLQLHQQGLAEQEKLDMSLLARDEKASAIFQAKGEATVLFEVAQQHLRSFEKWFLPFFSAIIAVYQAGMGVYLLRTVSGGIEAEMKQPLICAISMTAIAFISFLLSRYATGMSGQQPWQPLGAGGSFQLCVTLLCFAAAIGLALVQFKIAVVMDIIVWLIPILLVVLGIETALNIVLDVYRPRLKGQYNKSAFDSRLLGIISHPGQIYRTAATTIDYQFGFKVSQTWFYKLLEKAIVPLILFGAAALYLLSCIVIVSPNEEAIIEHFGNPLDEAGQVRHIGPGPALKWPWPIDIAYKYPTKKVSEIDVGFVPKIDPETGEAVLEPLLWGKSHYEKEYQLLVASESGQSQGGAVPVSLVIANVPVQYRVKDLYSFIYNHNEPERLLEAICYRELTKFAASAKIEAEEENESSPAISQCLVGAGRAEAERTLTERIQRAADEEKLGVEIVFLGLQGIHPPPDVAADYQKVVGAIQRKQALVLNACAERNKSLSELAGSVENTEKLSDLVSRYQQAKQKNMTAEAEKLGKELDTAFAEASGNIFKILREAKSYAFEKILLAKAAGERFDSQLKAYRAAEEIYKRQHKLAVLEESLENIRKFVVVADKNDTQVFTVDVQEKLSPSLYDISGLEATKPK
jgi:regulator of protease activity HflC (stomatin/prohibitin superfamily)